MTKLLAWMGANQLSKVTDYLVDELQRLARAGADFGIIAANTPHIVFEEVQQRSSIPLISIVGQHAQRLKSAGSAKPP